MLKAFALSVALHAMLLAASAHAAEGGRCSPVSKITSSPKDGIAVTKFTPGQFNFFRGYIAGAAPDWKHAKLPAEGALLLERKGDKGAVIVLIRGALACDPMPADQGFVAALKDIKTGALSEDGQEL